MVKGNDVLKVLQRNFGNVVSEAKLAKAAKEIAELDKEWEELKIVEEDMGWKYSVQCPDICYLGEQAKKEMYLEF